MTRLFGGDGGQFVRDLAAAGALGPLAVQLAQFLQSLALRSGSSEADAEIVALSAALASRAVDQGHVCLDLPTLALVPLQSADGVPLGVALPPAPEWLAALSRSPLVSQSSTGEEAAAATVASPTANAVGALPNHDRSDTEKPRSSSPVATPLYLDGAGRVYLQRYAHYELAVARELRQRAAKVTQVDEALLAAGIARLFPRGGELDAQALAAAVAVHKALTLICGGPGTGKTTTVARLLCLLQEQALASGQAPLRLLLLAPTGKAARRLAESIRSALGSLSIDEKLRATIPTEAHTVHRALGVRPTGVNRYRHHAESPLPADVVLVDEVSMVDLPLWYRLLSAVPADARLVLLGDKDQLVSVEAGAVLGEIHAGETSFSPAFAERLSRVLGHPIPTLSGGTPLRDCQVTLHRSYRYGEDSALGRLARSIQAERPDLAANVIEAMTLPGSARDCELIPRDVALSLPRQLERDLKPRILSLTEQRLSRANIEEQLKLLGEHQVLCAHRQGPAGVETLNRHVERWLTQAGLVDPRDPFYPGRPLLITENDYQLGLFNGDVGVVERTPQGHSYAVFPGVGGITRVPTARLPSHESVFACTVHKSQGSEYRRITLVLPDQDSPLLTRELVYTAITRAREGVTLLGSATLLQGALLRTTRRQSGLRDRLYGPAAPA